MEGLYTGRQALNHFRATGVQGVINSRSSHLGPKFGTSLTAMGASTVQTHTDLAAATQQSDSDAKNSTVLYFALLAGAIFLLMM